jgi:hypothetical protein
MQILNLRRISLDKGRLLPQYTPAGLLGHGVTLRNPNIPRQYLL